MILSRITGNESDGNINRLARFENSRCNLGFQMRLVCKRGVEADFLSILVCNLECGNLQPY